MSEGLIVGYQTVSQVLEILPNRILTRDASGDVTAIVDSTVDLPIVGVSQGKVALRTTASRENIAVKIQGLVRVPKKTDTAMKRGFIVTDGGTTTIDGFVCLMAVTATTQLGAYSDMGRVAENAAATDETVLIALNLR